MEKAKDNATNTEPPTEQDASSKRKEDDSTMTTEGKKDGAGKQTPRDSSGKENGKEEESPAMLGSAPNCEEGDGDGIPTAATGKRTAPEEDRSDESEPKRPKLEDDKMEEEEEGKEAESKSPANTVEDEMSKEDHSASKEEADTASHSNAIRQRLMALLGQTTKSSGGMDEMKPPSGASSTEDDGASAGVPKEDSKVIDKAPSVMEDKNILADGSISSHSSTTERDAAGDAKEDTTGASQSGETTTPTDTSDGDKAPAVSGEGATAAAGNKKSEHDPADSNNSSGSGTKDASLAEDSKPPAVVVEKEGETGLNVTGETMESQAVAFKRGDSDDEATKAAMKVPGVGGDTRQDDTNKVTAILKRRKEAEENNDAFMDGWYNWVNDLLEYHKKHGHCQVRDAESHALYNWLKRQRVMFRKGKLEEEKLEILRLLKTNGFETAKKATVKPPPEPVSKKHKSPKPAKPMSEKKRLKAMRNAGRNMDLALAVARAGEGDLAASLSESAAHTGEGVPMTGHDAVTASLMAEQQLMARRRDPAGNFLRHGMVPQDISLGMQLPGGALSSIHGGYALNAAEAQFQAQDLNLFSNQQAVLLLLQQQQAQQRAAQEELQRRQRQQDLLLLHQMLQQHPRQPPRGDP